MPDHSFRIPRDFYEWNPSCHHDEPKLMAHIREIDANIGIVIGIQVENETGLLGSARKVSDAADAAFASDVPEEFIQYMKKYPQCRSVRSSLTHI